MIVDGSVEGLDNPPERLAAGKGRADSSLRRLKIAGKPFYILRSRGSMKDIAYDHGRLLAGEIENAVFPEIISAIARGTDLGSPLLKAGATALFRGLTDCVMNHVSAEFSDAAKALAQGYADALAKPRFSQQQMVDAIAAIEVDNIADGITRRFQSSAPLAQGATVLEVAKMCFPELMKDEIQRITAKFAHDEDVLKLLGGVFGHMTHPNHRRGFACTAFSFPGGATKDGRHMHARNLDADLYNWNLAPAMFLFDETPGGTAKHKYIAFGTAGLLYPGGISGLNDAGIAVSLHQLSTTQYRTDFSSGRADIAPFVQQRILREAATIEEAVRIVQETKCIAAWVIFCSDAKSGRSLHIEFNGKETRVGPVSKKPFAQTNHFIHPDLVEHLFNADDAHFTPTLGKWMETRSRLSMVQQALAQSKKTAVDVDWAIDLLSSGRDWELVQVAQSLGLDPSTAGVERSFGRIPRKVYGQLGSIVRGDPKRKPKGDEAWMTIGDRLPACEGILAGWRIDWEKLEVESLGEAPLRRTGQFANTGRANWERSFELYLSARVACTRPRDDNGELLSRASTPEETLAGYQKAEALLNSAIEAAAQDRIVEIPYHYMRARVRHEQRQYAQAKIDWDLLRSIWAQQTGQPAIKVKPLVKTPRFRPVLHEYEAGLTLALAANTEDKRLDKTSWPGRAKQYQESLDLLAKLKARLFSDHPAHFDLTAWIDRIGKLAKADGTAGAPPEPNFITVE